MDGKTKPTVHASDKSLRRPFPDASITPSLPAVSTSSQLCRLRPPPLGAASQRPPTRIQVRTRAPSSSRPFSATHTHVCRLPAQGGNLPTAIPHFPGPDNTARQMPRVRIALSFSYLSAPGPGAVPSAARLQAVAVRHPTFHWVWGSAIRRRPLLSAEFVLPSVAAAAKAFSTASFVFAKKFSGCEQSYQSASGSDQAQAPAPASPGFKLDAQGNLVTPPSTRFQAQAQERTDAFRSRYVPLLEAPVRRCRRPSQISSHFVASSSDRRSLP
ncbi:hypothetical protein BDZ97DRAFT_1760667 [Flammula alnicola]|nr:hypothetical protein BDZ97DRAFT_1760667 [Flammula alnicola]